MPSKISVADAIKAGDAAVALGLKEDVVATNAFMRGVDIGFDTEPAMVECFTVQGTGRLDYYENLGYWVGVTLALEVRRKEQ